MKHAVGNIQICEDCGHNHVREIFEDIKFDYGLGSERTTLTANIPFYECTSCGFRWAAPAAERIQNQEITRHLGRVQGEAIRRWRESFGMSQMQLASLSGFGVASIKRWEMGDTIPNRSNSGTLKAVMEEYASAQSNGEPKPYEAAPLRRRTFRTSLSPRAVEAASFFNVRSAFPQASRQAA